MKYDSVIDYLVGTLGDSIQGFGATDDKVNKKTEAVICDHFEKNVCGFDGDEGCDFFKIGDGDVPFFYNGKFYEQTDDICLRSIVKRVMEQLGIGMVYQKNSHTKIAQECFESLVADERCKFELERRYVVFKNCVLDTKTETLYHHDIKFKTDMVLDFSYKKDGRSALWDRLIAETIPDAGMRQAFQMFCGAFLADRTEYKVEFICLLVGSGRNGKSVVTEAIAKVFGDKLVSSFSPEQLFRSSQRDYNLAAINGKVANMTDDMSNKDVSGGDFKSFMSGGRFMARNPYGRPFQVNKVPLMICCVNEIPNSTDDTNGYYRRLLPIVCPNQIADDQVDEQLPQKLSTEECKVAIFNWVLEGYRKFVECGGKINLSESIMMVREDIREDSNSARRWIREKGYKKVKSTGTDDPNWRSFKALMIEYVEYCREYSETPKTGKSVAKILKEMGLESKKERDTTWYCVGCKDGSTPSSPEPALQQSFGEEETLLDMPF